MSSYGPRPPKSPFPPQPNEYPPTLPPMPPHLQPPMPQFQPSMPHTWGYGVGQMAHSSENYAQNPPYPFSSPPPMLYQHSPYFSFSPQLLPIFPPLPLIPPPPPDFPCPPPPPPPDYPYPPPPPPPELPCLPSPILVKESKVETLKSFKNHELGNSNHGKPPKPHMNKINGDNKETVHVPIGHPRTNERTKSLWGRNNTENRLRMPTDFVCTMKFRNELPDITRECKILPLKKDPERYTRYNAASEKKLWKPEIHPEADLGIPLDLLDMNVYNPPKGERIPLDPEDEELLRDDDDDLAVAVTPALKTNGLKRKSRPDDKSISWLVKTQYIAPLNKKAIKEPVAKRENVEMPQRLGAQNILENLYDRESKIKEMEASSEACKSLPVHATNKELQPVDYLQMSSLRPRPPQSSFPLRPNEYPPTLPPLQPQMPPHLLPSMPIPTFSTSTRVATPTIPNSCEGGQKVETLKRFKNHELGNSNHGKPPKPHIKKIRGDYKEMVPVSIGHSQMSERTKALWDRKKTENRLRMPTDFVCKMKFRNELPDITRECKILPLKRDPERYTRYNAASEKKLCKPEIHPEGDLGIPLDLLDMSVYNPPKGERIPLDPEDEELLRDDDDDLAVAVTPAFKNHGLKIKSRPDDKSISWLVKTQYIAPLNTTELQPVEVLPLLPDLDRKLLFRKRKILDKPAKDMGESNDTGDPSAYSF